MNSRMSSMVLTSLTAELALTAGSSESAPTTASDRKKLLAMVFLFMRISAACSAFFRQRKQGPAEKVGHRVPAACFTEAEGFSRVAAVSQWAPAARHGEARP